MTVTKKPWQVRLAQTGDDGIRRERDRPVVAGLTVLTVMLAMAGLFADLELAPRALTIACYGVAVLLGLVSIAFLFIKRLWVARRGV